MLERIRVRSPLCLLIFIMTASGLASSQQQGTHLVILVHGLAGNEKELGYLQESMERQAPQHLPVVFHSAKCNLKRTTDGIGKGGQRLVQEVEEQIRAIDDSVVLLSFVGNSLGGLYARYAIAHLDLTGKAKPFVFCTTMTPHLGVSKETYVSLPGFMESLVADVLGASGRDMFDRTTLLHEMGTSPQYLAPLKSFQKRIAVANAFGTDFQVSVTTAAFLSKNSNYLHKRLPNKGAYALSVETEPTQVHAGTQDDVSHCLDALGWTKIFVDVRNEIPLPSLPRLFAKEATVPDKEIWTSQELKTVMSRKGKTWKLPLGHMVACANSKDNFNSWFNSNGRPMMDQLASDMLDLMQQPNINPQECKTVELTMD